MDNTHLVALPSSVANLEQYIRLVERFPRLTESEERELAERFRRDRDITAAWRLVTSHLRYVVYIAARYAGYGLPQEDLIQEGNVGLMKAVKRFDPSRGVRLVAYAAYWIRAQIHDYILRNWRIVRIATTKAKRKLFYKLRGAKRRLEWLNGNEAKLIADALDVRADDVIDMDAKLYAADESFDANEPDADDEPFAPVSYLEDRRYEPESVVAQLELVDRASTALHEGLQTLDARSRDIIERRWLDERKPRLTLQELGRRYGISAERVRQLEAAALQRLRRTLETHLGLEAADTQLVTP